MEQTDTSPLNTIEPDPCCAKRLHAALLINAKLEAWTCPKCGTEWKPTLHTTATHTLHDQPIRNWQPIIWFANLRL